MSRIGKSRGKEQITGCLGLGRGGNGEGLLMGMGFLWGGGKVLELDSGKGCTAVNIQKLPNRTLLSG